MLEHVIYSGQADQESFRDTYSRVITDLLEHDPRTVVGDADVGYPIYGEHRFELKEKYGDRIFECGIQEGNLVGMAAGLSLLGKTPYLATYAPFITRRVLDTVFISLAYAKLNARLFGLDPGFTSAFNGGTHSAIEDAAVMRTIPNITIFDCVDSAMLEATLYHIKDIHGLFYFRMPRGKGMTVKTVYEKTYPFQIGKANLLREGSDVTIIAAGLMVAEAMEAARILETEHISARVVDIYTLKPVDEEMILSCARETGAIVCCENHKLYGGLCTAVAETLMYRHAPCPMEIVAIADRFGEVGETEELRRQYGLTVDCIVDKVRNVLKLK